MINALISKVDSDLRPSLELQLERLDIRYSFQTLVPRPGCLYCRLNASGHCGGTHSDEDEALEMEY